MKPDNLYNAKFETLFGWIALERSERGITRCSLPEKQESKCMQEIKGWNSKHLETEGLFSKEIEMHLSGPLTAAVFKPTKQEKNNKKRNKHKTTKHTSNNHTKTKSKT